MLIAIIILALLALAAGAWALWSTAQQRGLRETRDRLQSELTESQTAVAQSQQQLQTLGNDLAQAQARQEQAKEDRVQLQTQFDKAQTQLKDTFQALAGEALKQSNAQFLQLAHKTFEGEQKDAQAQLDQRKAAIEATVKPVNIALEKYNDIIKQIEVSRTNAYGQLTKQVELLNEDQRRLRTETANLVQALRRPDVRGRWGEMQLRRVAELAGMIDHCDFTEQVAMSASEDQSGIRPDMIVTLPSQRQVIVDAKTPLDAFLSALDAKEDVDREKFIESHTRNIETHVKQLASKDYTTRFAHAADLVVLFIPGESFLYPAIQHRPDLVENAMRQGVVIATPTTLISLLKVIAMGWREEQIAENAQKIRDAAIELHKRLCTVVDHVQSVGKALNSATDHYDKFVSSFNSRLLNQARKIEELGAGSTKTLPEEISPIDKTTRTLEAQPFEGGQDESASAEE